MRSHHRRIVFVVTCAVIALAACSEVIGPGEDSSEATVLAAASPTSLTGTVGAAITDLPSVIAQDSEGNPIAGVIVTFAVTDGGGSLTSGVVTSNSAGIARVGGWILGKLPGLNVVKATSGSLGAVTFHANALTGLPASLIKLAGDFQSAAPGTALPILPRVRVTDSYGNGISGATVTFAIERGGGSVTGATVISDSVGTAELGSWTIGAHGPQSLVVRSGELPAQVFTAMAVAPPFVCEPAAALSEQIAWRSELTPRSCQGADGRFLELLSVTLTESTAYRFTLSSTDFDTYLELRDEELTLLASNDDRDSTATSSAMKALLPPGTYTLVASSSTRESVGSYSVSYGKTATDVSGCEDAFIARGVSTLQSSTYGDCKISDWEYADRFRIYLKAGTSVSIEVADRNYSGPTVVLMTPSGERVTAGGVAPYLVSLTYSAPHEGYYTVLAGLVNDGNAEYTLSIR